MMDHTEKKAVVVFRYEGRFAHFLRAEASASALSYPMPPRTVLLGVIGAVLGLEKDAPQVTLRDALIAVSGEKPTTHWHRAKFRKDPPSPLSRQIKAGAKGTHAPEKATLIKQEWLINPSYTVTVSLPESHHSEFIRRLRERAWYFCPSLGLSELIAGLEFVDVGYALPMREEQTVYCQSLVDQHLAVIDGQKLLEERLEIQVVRMPQTVTPDRVFTHTNYLIERRGRSIPVTTSRGWQIELSNTDQIKYVMFL